MDFIREKLDISYSFLCLILHFVQMYFAQGVGGTLIIFRDSTNVNHISNTNVRLLSILTNALDRSNYQVHYTRAVHLLLSYHLIHVGGKSTLQVI